MPFIKRRLIDVKWFVYLGRILSKNSNTLD